MKFLLFTLLSGVGLYIGWIQWPSWGNASQLSSKEASGRLLGLILALGSSFLC